MTSHIDPRIDHYKVLGVKQEASSADIKKAYRRLAKKYHPDSTGGDKHKEAKFKEISRAYDVLGDEGKRAEYDALRSGAGQFHNFQGFPGGGGGVDLGQIFAQMFQGAAQGGDRGEGGRQHHFAIGREVGHQGLEGVSEGLRFGSGHVHLPVACDDGLSHSVLYESTHQPMAPHGSGHRAPRDRPV